MQDLASVDVFGGIDLHIESYLVERSSSTSINIRILYPESLFCSYQLPFILDVYQL
jgi:hypothetical protein